MIYVDRGLVRRAWFYIYLYYSIYRRARQQYQIVTRRPPRQLQALQLVRDVTTDLKYFVLEKLGGIDREIEDVVNTAAERYLFVRYALSIKNFGAKIVLAFIASPPDITLRPTGPIVKPSSYINVNFIPVVMGGKMHRPLLARYFYSMVTASVKLRRYIMKENVHLTRVYQRSFEKYVEKGYPEGRAKKLAIRDAVRVIIGSVWLVRMHELLDTGLATPNDIMLPYGDMAEKARLGELIDPYFLAGDEAVKSKVYNYTWRNLLKRVSG